MLKEFWNRLMKMLRKLIGLRIISKRFIISTILSKKL